MGVLPVLFFIIIVIGGLLAIVSSRVFVTRNELKEREITRVRINNMRRGLRREDR
ncbi:MAG: hypothetical protein ACRDDY_00685 [Clostridium sp.]|uniref:hypothetical protein n=1 Tax=Clostridium sp. TaxID=1506 RepID=UPI003EE6ACEA